jgi:arylsulfatase A-like enzyme
MRKRIAALIVFLSLFLQECTTERERPNILWVVSEDNTTMLGCYGDKNARTPTLDKLAAEGILYRFAYSNAPVCAPARSTIITGMYASSLGTDNMRSKNPIPSGVRFFTQYLRNAGYYCSNNFKEDYNTFKSEGAWDESSPKATWRNRGEGQPFFSVFNFNITHEHVLFESDSVTQTDPQKIELPPYHPDTEQFRHDWAQYYDKISRLDSQISELLYKLKKDGLYENTVIFYYGDNGGILPGSKRFINEPGTHVPMIVRIPEKYKHLFREKRGTESNQLVSFVDLAPTVLSLCGVDIPEYMQGRAFLGSKAERRGKYVFMYHQRMDERYDFVRAVRNRKYRYIRNFMPYLPRGQHIEYMWRIPSMNQWYEMFRGGELNTVQSAFFQPRLCEELYDMENDPYGIRNLVNDPAYRSVLKKMRYGLEKIMIETRDTGFIPEPELLDISSRMPPYTYTASDTAYDVKKLLEVAAAGNGCGYGETSKIKDYLKSGNRFIRYWAVNSVFTLPPEEARSLSQELFPLLKDESVSVRIAAGEAVYRYLRKKEAIPVLKEAMHSGNKAARLAAVNAVERLGKDAEVFSKELNDLLNDPSKDVQKVVSWTLRNLDRKR